MGIAISKLARACVLLACLAASSSSVARVPDVSLASLQRDKNQIALALATHASQCVQRHDTRHVAFHGCIDWHSSVHGVWTLVAYTAMTGDGRFEPVIRNVLTHGKLARETALLTRDESFENPYGRAWLLRLAREYEGHYSDKRMRPIADLAAASLLARYQRIPPNPFASEYRNPAWALINLVDYYDFVGDKARAAATRKIIRSSFVDSGKPCNAARDRDGFMAICLNWAWAVSKTMGRKEFTSWALAFVPPEDLPEPVSDPDSAHEYGLNFSRAWGLWELGRRVDRAEYRKAYAAHVHQTFDRPAHWRGDYGSVGHWVPQFGMLAIQPLFAGGR